MIVILDLDHTLFNTDILKNDLCCLFKNLKISEDKFKKTLKESYRFDCDSLGCYSIEKHISLLPKNLKSETSNLYKSLINLIKSDVKKYLYQDVVPFLEILKRKKINTYLVTLGDNHFQEMKIKASGIGKYFKKIFITQGSDPVLGKLGILKKITYNDSALNINDNQLELLAVKKEFSNIKNLYIKRHQKETLQDQSTPVISSLMDALKYFVP